MATGHFATSCNKPSAPSSNLIVWASNRCTCKNHTRSGTAYTTEEVETKDIWEGYDLAFNHSPSHPFSSPCHPFSSSCHPERSEGSEDINVDVHRSIRHSVPQDDMDGEFPQDDKMGGHPQDDKNVVWDEYWDWSPQA